MGVTVTGMIGVENMLARVDMDTRRRVTSKMYVKAVQIRDMARRMAPIDDGNLEEAIKVRPETPGRARNESGQFVRQEVEVFVDMGMPVPGRPGKTVGDYAYEMHEHLTPVGPLQLGPKSEAKSSGVPVGGAFLTRAMEEVAGDIVSDLALDLFGD